MDIINCFEQILGEQTNFPAWQGPITLPVTSSVMYDPFTLSLLFDRLFTANYTVNFKLIRDFVGIRTEVKLIGLF